MNKLYKIVKQIRIQVNLPWKEKKGKKIEKKITMKQERKRERNGRKKITPLRGEKEWKGKGK